ncbi:GtrA family protein [Falsiporphyromonas endometrii]|uniref:GtrA family protein n=1 Tax=Falsiporphyromonas endometrii TaxID=1387297 RepID=A0ABV9K513_9PORP
MKLLENIKQNEALIQLIKYGLVGVVNTLITAVVIAIFLKVIGTSDFIANICGYIAGLINSFLLNKKWTFSAHGNWLKELVVFLLGFLFCYVIQYALVYSLNNHTSYDRLYNHFIGMVFYTLINFAFNKFVTFRK